MDFTAIDGALLEIAKQVKELDDIRTWTDTIRSNGQKILERLRISTGEAGEAGGGADGTGGGLEGGDGEGVRKGCRLISRSK